VQIDPLVKFILLASVATFISALALPAEAVTLNVFGTAGVNGADGVGGPGSGGGVGGAASAVTLPNSDPTNTQTQPEALAAAAVLETPDLREGTEALAATTTRSRSLRPPTARASVSRSQQVPGALVARVAAAAQTATVALAATPRQTR
jgi:hypothetical protein